MGQVLQANRAIEDFGISESHGNGTIVNVQQAEASPSMPMAMLKSRDQRRSPMKTLKRRDLKQANHRDLKRANHRDGEARFWRW